MRYEIVNTGTSHRLAPVGDQRVMMGFITESGEEHSVMVNKVNIWHGYGKYSGKYNVYLPETSPVRHAPIYTSNLTNLGGRFWSFFRR